MDSDEIVALLARYPGTRLVEANGDAFAVHDPDDDYDRRPRQGWATVVNSDVNDTASDLDRPGAFRLNIGLPKARFAELFPVAAAHDTTARDTLFPHPVYAAHHWVSVVEPDTTWPRVRALLDDAHAFAVRKHGNATRRRRA
jgi:hypothetical protein